MIVPAFAKLNLSLEVLDQREDGFHEITTVLQAIDLADRLEFTAAPGLIVECDNPEVPSETNLVRQAALALSDRCNVSPQVRIVIKKGIPVGMGLGGGSSDAAATLLALNRFWDLGLATEDLATVAATLGSDVSFFLLGGTALAQGRGEQIAALPNLPSALVTLVCPASTIPGKTGVMYSQLTRAHYSDGGVTRRMVQILAGGQFVVNTVSELLFNAFESVAPQVFPELSSLYREFDSLAGQHPHLCGAGPALFTFPSSREEYQRVAEALQPRGIGVYLVSTSPAADGSGLRAHQ